MYYKENSIRKTSPIYIIKILISCIQQRLRTLSLSKLIFIIISTLCLTYIIFINKKDQLCDPTDHLYWFCPWPDPKTTVCNWDDHFTTKSDQTR
jgi:hypothetical protein